MKEQGLAHLTFTSKQIRERVAKAKIVKAVRFHIKRIRERKFYEKQILYIQKIYRGRKAKINSFLETLNLSKYPKILILKEQRRLFFTLLEATVKKIGKEFVLKEFQQMVKVSEEFDTLRYGYPSHKVVKSKIPIINYSMPGYYSKIRYCPKIETFENKMSIFEKYGSFMK